MLGGCSAHHVVLFQRTLSRVMKQWKHTELPASKKFTVLVSTGKVVASISGINKKLLKFIFYLMVPLRAVSVTAI